MRKALNFIKCEVKFKDETKFKALEEERTDALEMAKEAYEEREEAPSKKVKL